MATPIPLANYLSRTLKRAGPARALALLLIAIGIPVAAALAASSGPSEADQLAGTSAMRSGKA